MRGGTMLRAHRSEPDAPIVLGVGLTGARIASAGGIILGVMLAALAFSSLGVPMAAPAVLREGRGGGLA